MFSPIASIDAEVSGCCDAPWDLSPHCLSAPL